MTLTRGVVAFLALALGAAALAASPAGAAQDAAPLELRYAAGAFRPEGPSSVPPGWYRDLSEKVSPVGRRYVVAITRDSLDPDQRRQMEAAGATILGYVPEHGYRLRIDPPAAAILRSLPFVAWVGEPPPHLKVQPELSALAGHPSAPVRVRVILEAGEAPDRAGRALAGLDVTSAPSGKEGAWRLEAMIPAARLAAALSRLSGLPEVEAVEIARTFRPMNQDAVWVHQSFAGPSPQQTPVFDQGIFGCGQILGLADTGQDYDLCFFRDLVNGPPPFSSCLTAPCPAASPATNRRKDVLYYNWSGTPVGDDDTCPTILGTGSGHGTHTSGSAAGDQSPYADCAGFTSPGRSGGDGQAPGAKLVIQEMGDGLEYLNNRGGTLWNLADVAYRSGVRIHSDSWGGACHDALGNCIPGCTLPYDSFARDADLAMWTYPDLLLVTSAGNAGQFCAPPVSIGTPANAKNLVTAGSVGHGTAAGIPSSFSSVGPVFDGRLKPTLVAQGELVVSAGSDANPASNNCDTCSLGGTSMSSPTTAGLAALVREYYTAGYYATGARNPGSGLTPSGALLKATLIDGASPLIGATTPGFQGGYGRILLNGTLAFAGSPFQLRVDDDRAGLATGGTVTRAYDVASGEPFRATLVWTDFPAALNVASARVNELKLEVIDPNGNAWFQTLDGVTGLPVATSNPAAGHDTVNVEERLVFSSPAPGRWVVRVRGVNVPMGPQPFALVVRGALSDCPAPSSPGAPSLSTPADHQVQASWGAVTGAAAYNLYRSLGACPAGPGIPVATAVTGTLFLDTTVSGGTIYSYRVTAASDAGAFCESPPSPCAQIAPTGDCFLPPAFAGVASAASAGTGGCAVNLSWSPATSPCTPGVRYNVYRGTSPGFVPGPANRIARCVATTSFTDSVNLVYGTTYTYTVRAEDATTGHGGPCRGGNEETNGTRVSAAPEGPPASGTFLDDAGDTGTARFAPASPWLVAVTGGHAGPKVYRGDSDDTACADLTSPVLTLGSPALGPQLSFATSHTLEYDPFGFFGAEGSVGQVEIATGPAFSAWTRVPLTPDYPAVVEFPLNNCDSTGNLDTYFSGDSQGYQTYTASLANWAGGDVRIRFRLSGDLLYPGGSWWVDEIQVTQSLVPQSCATLPAGPPPIPDGASVPGQPLAVTLSGTDLHLTWDATQCPPVAANIYWGSLGDFSAFSGGFCNQPATGSATISLAGNVWFVVAGTDGVTTDGSWSRDALGNEKSYAGATAACPAITLHSANNGCP